jgi:hypothetical protein
MMNFFGGASSSTKDDALRFRKVNSINAIEREYQPAPTSPGLAANDPNSVDSDDNKYVKAKRRSSVTDKLFDVSESFVDSVIVSCCVNMLMMMMMMDS